MIQVLQGLFDEYDKVQIKDQNRFFPPVGLKEFINRFRNYSELKFSVIGKSEFGNDIYKVTIGNGPIKIMAWSQMHGNEATGTLALLELIQLLSDKNLENVWSEVKFVCVFMVNPDGASKFSRRNGNSIDVNRDAQAKKALETQVLVEQIEEEQPDIALNLHDQRNIFGVSGFGNPATISFLAPSYNWEREINECRKKCMLLISGLAEGLRRQIGNHIGKYSDEYYPTAFGEFVQSKGIPCVLIESGATYNDPNREIARKMNVYCILKLFSDVIDNSWKKRSVREYHAIPENNTDFFDIIIKNVKVKFGIRTEIVDLGILVKQELVSGVLKDFYQLADLGDLSFKNGLEVLDALLEPEVHQSFELNELLTIELPTLNVSFEKGVRQ